jgi:hypothetical protein
MDPMTTIFKGFSEANSLKAEGRMALQNANITLDQTARAEGQDRRDASQLTGAQIAAAGASGTTLEGSNSAFIIDQAVQSEMNALNTRYAGQVKATGYQNEALAKKWQARGALTGSILKAHQDLTKQVLSAASGGGG